MAQGRSTKIISMMKWIRASRLSIKNSLSLYREGVAGVGMLRRRRLQDGPRPRVENLVTREREFFIDNLLVRIHFIIVMIRWTGLKPWEFEFSFPGSLTSTFLVRQLGPRPRVHNLVNRLWSTFVRTLGSDQLGELYQLTLPRINSGGGFHSRRTVAC